MMGETAGSSRIVFSGELDEGDEGDGSVGSATHGNGELNLKARCMRRICMHCLATLTIEDFYCRLEG